MMAAVPRTATYNRETAETKVFCQVTLPTLYGGIEVTAQEALENMTSETQTNSVATGIPFLDHMLHQLAFHGRMGLQLQVEGDLEIDNHHTVEDVGLVLGRTLKAAIGEGKGIERYGQAMVPMDEVLALCAVDVSGRAHASCQCPFTVERLGSFETECLFEFLTALARGGDMTLHLKIMTPGNNHHMAEAIFKSLAVALRNAVALNPNSKGVPSTKGLL